MKSLVNSGLVFWFFLIKKTKHCTGVTSRDDTGPLLNLDIPLFLWIGGGSTNTSLCLITVERQRYLAVFRKQQANLGKCRHVIFR